MSLSTPGHVLTSKDRTVDVMTKENVAFKDLFLSPNVLSGLQKARFERPSPIQLKAIPYGRCGLDLIVQAKSGTGKTCVFTVVALEAISVDTSCLQVIILAPTREIAVQIEDVITAVGQDMKGLKVSAFIGGRPIADDKINAKGCHIAVGSPGRIFQLIQMDVLRCQNVRIFVLDEADKLLEENFQSQINSIYSMLPTNKQMIAASATYPEELAEFVTRYMRDPTFVRLNPTDMALLGVKQYYLLSESPSDKFCSIFESKIEQVIDLLSVYPFQQALIFSNYHTHAKDLSEACNSSGLPATYISGNMEQERRLQAMRMLKDFKCRVLISTDLTARGIDAQNVDLVLNLDVPNDWETYMHRTGRAGRYGSHGAVISIITSGNEVDLLSNIAETCSVRIFPITMNLGRVEIGETPINNKVKITGARNNPRPTNESKINIASSQVDKGPKREQPVLNKDLPAGFPQIPSLPELMSKGKTTSEKISFGFSDLMENLLYYKEHGTFKELKCIEEHSPQSESESLHNGSEISTEDIPVNKHTDSNMENYNLSESEQSTSTENSVPHEKDDVPPECYQKEAMKNEKVNSVEEKNTKTFKEKSHVISSVKRKPVKNEHSETKAIRNCHESAVKQNEEKTKKKRRKSGKKETKEESATEFDAPEFLLPRFSSNQNEMKKPPKSSHKYLDEYRHYQSCYWNAYHNWQQYWYNIQMLYGYSWNKQ